jgi:hypothetical protein
LEAESEDAAFVDGLVESWAAMARGRTATHVTATTHLKDFETRECMRFSSATDVNIQ